MVELNDKERMVLDIMVQAGKPVRPGDVAKAAGLDSQEIYKIIQGLQKKGLVNSPKRCLYAPVKA